MGHTDFVTMGKFLNISELRIFIVNKYDQKKKKTSWHIYCEINASLEAQTVKNMPAMQETHV